MRLPIGSKPCGSSQLKGKKRDETATDSFVTVFLLSISDVMSPPVNSGLISRLSNLAYSILGMVQTAMAKGGKQ